MEAVKLIDVSPQGQFAVTEEGGRVLSSAADLCNLVFIFGNARSGKSFLMNRLLACVKSKPIGNIFKVINSSLPCTKGADISSFVLPSSALHPSEHKTVVGFVDVEGQGDAGEAHDTLLALPLLLTSKVVLFNHKGAPTVGHMLEKLGVLARAAQKVRSGMESTGDEEDDEEDEAEEKKNGAVKLFGHLHIVFRDFSFDGDESTVLDQLLTPETVPREKKTLGARANYDPAEAIRDRNEIRRLIKMNFESVHAWIFPQPSDPDTLKEHAELPAEMVSEDFQEVTQALFESIASQTSEPRPFNGKNLDGPRINQLQHLLVDCLNKQSIIDVPTVFRAMEQQRLYHARDTSLNILTQAASEIEACLPLSSEELSTRLNHAMKESFACFDHMTAGTTLEEEAKVVLGVLQETSSQKAAALEKKNSKLAGVFVDNTLKIESHKMMEEFRLWCSDKMGSEQEEIETAFRGFQKACRQRVEKTLSGLPQVLGTPAFEEKCKAADEKPLSLLAIKQAQNNSFLLDVKAKKIAEESAKRLNELMHKNDALLENVAKIQTEAAEKVGEAKQAEQHAVAEKEEVSKKADNAEKQLRAKNLKLAEITKQRDAEKQAKEKLAKQIADLEAKEQAILAEKLELERKAQALHKEGWLMKKGRSYPRSWQKRYFRVEQGVLAYYAEAECKERKGFVGINNASVVQTFDPRALKNEKYRHAFQIIADDRSIVCKPLEEGDAAAKCQKEWTAYLEYVAKGISRDSAKPPIASTPSADSSPSRPYGLSESDAKSPSP